MTDKLIYQKARKIYTVYRNCKEVQRNINIKMIISIIFTVIWYYVWATSAITYFSKPWATFNPKNVLMYLSVAVIIAIPLYFLKKYKWYKFKPFLGIITNTNDSVMTKAMGYNKKYIDFNVASIDNSKIVKYKIKDKKGVLGYFKNNTPVLFLRGLEYPVKISVETSSNCNEPIFCSCCGTFNPNHYNRCLECSVVLWNKDV